MIIFQNKIQVDPQELRDCGWIEKVAFGVAKFDQALGSGVPALKDLLGGSATIQLTEKTDFYCGWGKAHCVPPRLARGGGTWVLLQESSFDNMGLHRGAQLVVHELAHVIDWQNNLSLSWLKQHDPLTDYAANPADLPIVARPSWEVWAEGVTVYVFGHYDAHGDFVDNTGEVLGDMKREDRLNIQMEAMQHELEEVLHPPPSPSPVPRPTPSPTEVGELQNSPLPPESAPPPSPVPRPTPSPTE